MFLHITQNGENSICPCDKVTVKIRYADVKSDVLSLICFIF